MFIVFFLALGLFLYPLFIYPVVLIVFRCFIKKSLSRYWSTDSCILRPPASFAVLLCAHNEEAVLEAKLRDLVAQRACCSTPLNIYVYLDGCTDGSTEICRRFSDQVNFVVSPTRTGKSVGMSSLAQIAVGDLFVFTDANVFFSRECLPRVKQYFEKDATVGCVLAHVSVKNPHECDVARSEKYYWLGEETIKRLETKVGSTISGTGAFFAIRRELYAPTPSHIIDDFHTTVNVLFLHKRIIQADDVVVFERATTCKKEQWGRKVRISCRAFNCYRLLKNKIADLPWALRFMFISHKLIRWFGAAPMLIITCALLVCGFSIHLWLGLSLMLSLAILELAYAYKFPLLSLPSAVFRSFLATTLGVFLSLRGERFVTWESPQSTR